MISMVTAKLGSTGGVAQHSPGATGPQLHTPKQVQVTLALNRNRVTAIHDGEGRIQLAAIHGNDIGVQRFHYASSI